MAASVQAELTMMEKVYIVSLVRVIALLAVLLKAGATLVKDQG